MDRTMTRTTQATRQVLTLLALLTLVACDKSGVHDLGRANDTLATCGAETSTWMRSLDEETEIVVLGSSSPGAGASSGCFVRAIVNQDSSVAMETGFFSVNSAGTGSTQVLATYRFLYQPELRPLQREGAVRFDQNPPIEQELELGRDGEQLTFSVDGEARNLTGLPEIIRRLSPNTQEGAEDIFRLVNMMFYMSQTRIEGFGASGMTRYTAAATFNGIVAGTYRVAVQGGLRIGADLTYYEMRDLTDIQMDGNQHTMIDLGANGPLSEELTFTLDHPEDGPIVYVINYDDVDVANGATASGEYHVVSDGAMFDLTWMLAQDVHIRNVLPVGE